MNWALIAVGAALLIWPAWVLLILTARAWARPLIWLLENVPPGVLLAIVLAAAGVPTLLWGLGMLT